MVAVFLIAWVVVVGGIVCVKEEEYTFAEYLGDLAGIHRLLLTAILAAVGHAIMQLRPEMLRGSRRSPSDDDTQQL